MAFPLKILILSKDIHPLPPQDGAIIFDTEPGDIFSVRNVANMIPAYKPPGESTENGVVAVERHHEETNERCVVIVNAGDGQWDAESLYGINVGDPWDGFGGFVEIFNSQDEAFGGWPNSGNKERGFIEQDGKELKPAIPKLGVVVLKQTPPKPPGPDPEAVLAALNQSGAGNGKL